MATRLESTVLSPVKLEWFMYTSGHTNTVIQKKAYGQYYIYNIRRVELLEG